MMPIQRVLLTAILFLSGLHLTDVSPAYALQQPAAPTGTDNGTQDAVSPEVQALLDAGHKAQFRTPPALDEAERLYGNALTTARGRRDMRGESKALLNLGNVAAARGDTAKAQDFFQRSLEVCRANGDKTGQADALLNNAILFRKNPDDAAIERCKSAQSLFHDAGDSVREVQAWIVLGNLENTRNLTEDAATSYKSAIQLARSITDEKDEADALWYLGTVTYSRLGEPAVTPAAIEQAKDCYQRAVVLYHKLNDTANEAWTHQILGDLYTSGGQYDIALKHYKEEVMLYRHVPDKANTAEALRRIANFQSQLGRPVDELRSDQEAQQIYKDLGDKRGQAIELMHIAALYDQIGQKATVLRDYLEAVNLLDGSGDDYDQVDALYAVIHIYEGRGQHDLAMAYARRLMPLLRKPATGNEQNRHLTVLADIYFLMHDYAMARASWEKLLAIERQSGQLTLAAFTLHSLGLLEQRVGHQDRALDYFRQELVSTEGAKEPLSRFYALTEISEIEEARHDLVGAERDLRESVALLETARGALGGLSEAKSTFLTKFIYVYRDFLGVLLRRGKAEEAFALVQKMKARALLDILNDGKVQLQASLSPEDREKEKSLRQISFALNYQLVREGVQNEVGSRKRAEAIKLRLRAAEHDLQLFDDSLYARDPDLARIRAAKTITLSDVAGFLPADTALLEYLPLSTDTTDEVVLFVVTCTHGTPVLETRILRIKARDLGREVSALQSACADPRRPYRESATALYRALIQPAEASIRGKKRLLICPEGVLWDVPFAALLAPTAPSSPRHSAGQPFLLHRFEVTYAYSATGAAAAFAANTGSKRRHPERTMLAFANPNFGDKQRFGDDPDIPGQRPIPAPSRPIAAPSRKAKPADRPIAAPSRRAKQADRPIAAPSRRAKQPDRPIAAPSRKANLADRPIAAPSLKADPADRPIAAPSRKVTSADRPIAAPSRTGNTADRPIAAPSRDLYLPRGGYLSDLPGTQLEVTAIKQDFKDATIYTGNAAQEATAKREAGKYRYLHFATHGFFNDAAPLLSAVVLALPDKTTGEDGFLTAREIFDLDLNADMVVLSACNTARGEKRSGEGIIGLTWALFAAGAPTQVVSQWSVNDESTAQLMKRFYANLTGKQMHKGEALRQAALSIMTTVGSEHGAGPNSKAHNPKWSHPYYWAPFVLMGDWR